MLRLGDGSWGALNLPGPNGFLNVLMCLKWWREQVATETNEWKEVVEDVTWVLRQMNGTPAPAPATTALATAATPATATSPAPAPAASAPAGTAGTATTAPAPTPTPAMSAPAPTPTPTPAASATATAMSALGEDAEVEVMDGKQARIWADLEAQGQSLEEIEEVLMDMDAGEEE
ncbi:hypothetical protein B0H14DRAFT_3486062 [Mycena olivaceomarginata]|nr:hypothetical protein B0H14DRAFT_3486062 [Mycena olivaceomarginata]